VSLAGRKAAISGANQGLGLAVAEAFVRAGADVLIGARDLAKLRSAQERLQGLASGAQQVLAQGLDVADEASASAFMGRAAEAWGRLDVLVNNAGVHGPKGALDQLDGAAWEQAVAVNLFGAVRLCRLGLPLLRLGAAARIINVSGGGATAPMPGLSAYAASKAGLVRFTETLAEELRGAGIAVNALAPGAMNTRLLDDVLEAGPGKVGQAYYDKALKQKAEGGTPPEKGAALAVYLASRQSDGITGKLISAVWDPWQGLEGRRAQLDGSDIYTLRRIVPKDRGLDF
jgi:3-oxoacyl-[acyl-carrier protein] reductase